MLKALYDDFDEIRKKYEDKYDMFLTKKYEIITNEYKKWFDGNIITDECLCKNYVCRSLEFYDCNQIYILFEDDSQNKTLEIETNKQYRLKSEDPLWMTCGEIYKTEHCIKYGNDPIYKSNCYYETIEHEKITFESNKQLYELCEYMFNFIKHYDEYDMLISY